MKKALAVALVMALLGSVSVAFAEYNRDASVKVMRDNLAAFGKLRAAAGGGDYTTAADSLMAIANGSLKLLAMDPPKGQKAEWEQINKEMVKVALKGVEAAVEKNKAGVDAALAEIGAVQRKGHTTFR